MFDSPRLVTLHARRAPFVAVLVAAATGGSAVLIRAFMVDEARELLQITRLSAVLVAAAAAAATENCCVAITATTSLTRSRSSWLGAAMTAVLAITAWVGPVIVASEVAGDSGGLPLSGLLIELCALLVVGWLLTESVARHRGPSGAGAVAGAVLTLAVVMTLMTPHTMNWLWRGPDPNWWRIHVRWVAIAGAAAGCLGVSLRDWAAPHTFNRRVQLQRRRRGHD